MCETVESHVDRLFRDADARKARTNPVTGAVLNEGSSIERHKELACRAIRAREIFARTAPSDAPELPLSYKERERLDTGSHGRLAIIVAWYAESVWFREYDMDIHPTFEQYARGIMASPYAPSGIKQDAELRRRFPPRSLPGLGPYLIWTN
jgi:hypothetical protein